MRIGPHADGIFGDAEAALGIAFGGGEFGHAGSGTQQVQIDVRAGLPVVRLMTVPLSVPAMDGGGEKECGKKLGESARKQSTSSSAPLGGGGTNGARAAHLGFRDLLDFGEDKSGFIFEGSFHEFVVAFGIFSGAMFEFEVAKIVVDGIAALEELIELGAVRGEIGSVRLNVKDEEERRRRLGRSKRRERPSPGGQRARRMWAKKAVPRFARNAAK